MDANGGKKHRKRERDTHICFMSLEVWTWIQKPTERFCETSWLQRFKIQVFRNRDFPTRISNSKFEKRRHCRHCKHSVQDPAPRSCRRDSPAWRVGLRCPVRNEGWTELERGDATRWNNGGTMVEPGTCHMSHVMSPCRFTLERNGRNSAHQGEAWPHVDQWRSWRHQVPSTRYPHRNCKQQAVHLARCVIPQQQVYLQNNINEHNVAWCIMMYHDVIKYGGMNTQILSFQILSNMFAFLHMPSCALPIFELWYVYIQIVWLSSMYVFVYARLFWQVRIWPSLLPLCQKRTREEDLWLIGQAFGRQNLHQM